MRRVCRQVRQNSVPDMRPADVSTKFPDKRPWYASMPSVGLHFWKVSGEGCNLGLIGLKPQLRNLGVLRIRAQHSWDPISCFFFSVLLVKPGFFQKIFLGVGLQRSHISGGNEVDWSPKPGISDKD